MIDMITFDYIILFVLVLILSKIFRSPMALAIIISINFLIGYMLIKDFTNIETIPMFTLSAVWCGLSFYLYTMINYYRGVNNED